MSIMVFVVGLTAESHDTQTALTHIYFDVEISTGLYGYFNTDGHHISKINWHIYSGSFVERINSVANCTLTQETL